MSSPSVPIMKSDPDPRAIALGQRMQRLRKRAGLNQLELAQRIGFHVNSVGKWESGKQDLRAVELPIIAAALGVSVEVLLGIRSEILASYVVRTERGYFTP